MFKSSSRMPSASAAPARPPSRSDRGRASASLSRSSLVRSYNRFLPRQFLALMGKKNFSDLRLGDSTERYLTVMFSDIRGFTSLSESMTRQENFAFINGYLSLMEPVMFRYRGFVDKYIGDAIMALFPTGADDAVRAAIGMLGQLKKLNTKRAAAGKSSIRIGIGLNSGVMMVGAVGGPHRVEPTVISDAVNLASRIEGLTKIYGVPLLVTEHTYYGLSEALARDVRFIDRVRVRGKEQPQSVYEVFLADPPRVRMAKRQTRPIFEEALAHYHFKDIPTARRLLRRCLAACPEDSATRAYMERCRRFARSGIHEGTGEIGLSVKWSPAVAMGEPLLDKQHRELFALANRFVHTMSSATAFYEVQEILDFLSRYVKEHFDSEEQRMRAVDYPLLDLQLEQHQRFSRLFARLSKDLQNLHSGGRVFLLFRVQLLVVDWLVHHTMKLDRHFGAYVKALRSRRRSTAHGEAGPPPSRQP